MDLNSFLLAAILIVSIIMCYGIWDLVEGIV